MSDSPTPTLPPGAAQLVFVGGTGRSGTHVIAELLGRHPRYTAVPLEARFHAKPRGFPDLLSGAATKAEFLRKLRRYWWRRIPAGEPIPAVLPQLPMGRKVNGLYRLMPRERFDAAVASFDTSFDADPDDACRALFNDLLWPVARESGTNRLVEMTTDNVMQAGTLGRLFPEAKFVLTVRDGRDAGASKASRRQRSHHPTDVLTGIDWWLERMLRAERGLRELDPGRSFVIGLDSFVSDQREETLAGLLDFLEVPERPKVRRFFDREMNPEGANRDRWREGLSYAEQGEVNRRYEAALERLEAKGSRCAPLLRRAL